MGECTHERFITLMFGERECLDCGHVELPHTPSSCRSSEGR